MACWQLRLLRHDRWWRGAAAVRRPSVCGGRRPQHRAVSQLAAADDGGHERLCRARNPGGGGTGRARCASASASASDPAVRRLCAVCARRAPRKTQHASTSMQACSCGNRCASRGEAGARVRKLTAESRGGRTRLPCPRPSSLSCFHVRRAIPMTRRRVTACARRASKWRRTFFGVFLVSSCHRAHTRPVMLPRRRRRAPHTWACARTLGHNSCCAALDVAPPPAPTAARRRPAPRGRLADGAAAASGRRLARPRGASAAGRGATRGAGWGRRRRRAAAHLSLHRRRRRAGLDADVGCRRARA